MELNTLKLKSSDLNDLELDLTVKGKTGSCNSCYLGDAFRCAGMSLLCSQGTHFVFGSQLTLCL